MGSLHIEQNPALRNLGGLDRVYFVGDSLIVTGNASLTCVRSLGKVARVMRYLEITDNPCLPATSAEAVLDSIGEDNVGREVTLSGNDGPCEE